MRIRLSFIETSGGQEKGKAGRPRVRNSCVRVCVPRHIRYAIKFEQTREKEKGETKTEEEGSCGYRSAKGLVYA